MDEPMIQQELDFDENLQHLKSMTPKTLKLILDEGITTLKRLATCSSGDISNIDGISDNKARAIIYEAREKLGMCGFIPVDRMDEHHKEIYDITIGHYIPRCAGYHKQSIESCDNCRFSQGSPDGGLVCKLYVDNINFKYGWVHFVDVDPFGKCNHYRKHKKQYRLNGIPSISVDDIRKQIRGSMRKKEK